MQELLRGILWPVLHRLDNHSGWFLVFRLVNLWKHHWLLLWFTGIDYPKWSSPKHPVQSPPIHSWIMLVQKRKINKSASLGANAKSSSLTKQYPLMNGAANVPFSYFLITVVATSDSVFVVSFFAPLTARCLKAPSDARVYFCILASCSILIPFTLYHQDEWHPVNWVNAIDCDVTARNIQHA